MTSAISPVRAAAGWFGSLALGLVLLIAVYAKAIDPAAFADQLTIEGLGFGAPFAMAIFAVMVEAVFGVALLLGVRRPIVLVPTSLMVAFFLFLTGRSWWLDAHGLLPEGASCGCFGNLVERTPEQAFWSDALLLVPTLALAWWGRDRGSRPARVRLAVAGVAALAVGGFATKAPELPLDDIATRLRPGVQIEGICAGEDPRVCLPQLIHLDDLTAGEHWVILTDLATLGPEVEALNQRVWSGAEPLFHVLSLATVDGESAQTFGLRYGPAFEIAADTPPALIRPLYRRLPRSFRVVDGEVVETVSGWPPWLETNASGDSR